MSKDYLIGVLGCGNQGSAIVKGLGEDYTTIGCDRNQEKLDHLDSLNQTTKDLAELAQAEIIFLTIKPSDVESTLNQLDLNKDQVLVSAAAGIEREFLEKYTKAKVVRLMPNLAAEYNEMATAVTFGDVDKDTKQGLTEILNHLGEVVELEEKYMDLATALNGSGPAFVYYLINSFKQAVEQLGMNKQQAEELVLQTFSGAVTIAEESNQDLSELIEAVCSPGGTTIEGMQELRDSSVEQDIFDAIQATHNKAKEISAEQSDTNFRAELPQVQRVVVKVGTSSLTNNSGLDQKKLKRVVDNIMQLVEMNKEVILVSSGAIGAGRRTISPDENIKEMQAASTIGQSKLMSFYSDLFLQYGREVAQLLLTDHDLQQDKRFKNINNTIEQLLNWNTTPIINENDAVATEEIKVGDNDILASHLAKGIDAGLLVFLTDVDGVYKNGKEQTELIYRAGRTHNKIKEILTSSPREFGGIKTKIEGAVEAQENDINAVIASSAEDNILRRIINGEQIGTYFKAK